MEYLKKDEGFTLLEVLLTLGIIGIIFASLSTVNITGFQVWNFNREKIEVQQLTRRIMGRITPYIRVTTEIDQSYLSEQLKIKFAPRTDNSGNTYQGMIFGLNTDGQFYYRKIYENDPLSDEIFLSSANDIIISDLSFVYHSNLKVIEIQFTLETDVSQDYTLIDRIYLRNSNISISSS